MGKKRKMMNSANLQRENGTQQKMTDEDKEANMASRGSMMYILMFSVFVLVVYIYTMYPTIMGGDSGELIAAAQELGVAHPPGYPLFTVLTWLAIYIIPVEDVAWKANLLNAIFSAAAALVFALVIHRYTGSLGCAIGGSAAWCFCKLTWTWSASAEVFGLNNLFIVTLLYLMVVFQDTSLIKKPITACFGAFMCGLSLTNQHTLVIYVAVIALWVLLELHRTQFLNFWLLVHIGLCFCGGLLPYIYLPLSAYLSNGRWTWGDQRTFAGFFKHFLRQEYGTFDLAKDKSGDTSSFLWKLNMYGQHVITEFSIVSLILFLLGLKEAFNGVRYKRKYSLAVSLAMMMIYMAFFSWRANLNLSNTLFLGVVQRFWMQADCVFVLVASIGAFHLQQLLKAKFPSRDNAKVLVGIGLAVCAWQVQRNFSECNQRNNRVVEEFGLRLYENLPPNTLLFTKGDLPSNIFRYLYLSGNYRPDVTVFDQEVLTLPWSVPMMGKAYPKIVFPGHHMEYYTGYIQGTNIKVFNTKAFFDINIERFTIIACIGIQDHDHSWKEGYDLFPFGPCSLVYRKGHPVDINTMADVAHNMTVGWNYPFQGFDETSWERVATDEMWNSKTKLGLHLYLEAVAMDTNVEKKTAYILKSYEIYKNAIEAIDFEVVPDYWHKNYALVCDKMLRIEHNHSNVDLAQKMIKHFERYLEMQPSDTDNPVIRTAVKSLKADFAEMNNVT